MAEIEELPTTETNIGAELWALIETIQGQGFISDEVAYRPPDYVFGIARGALRQARRQVYALEKFLKRHGQY